MGTLRGKRSDKLLKALEGHEQVLIVSHDNPDPDAIASGWVVHRLVKKYLNLPVRLVAGGDVVRAENLHMIVLLQPPLELVQEIEVSDQTAVVLVDCGVAAGNHILADQNVRPVAVIDHHSTRGRRPRLAFRDIRRKAAATASIAAGYLRERGVEPDGKLATALVYAIRSETRAYETYHSRLDRSIIPWLTHFADPAALAEIENAPLPREYFGDLVLALQSTFVYDDAALCLLPRANGPEIVGEVADLLIRREFVQRVLCGAMVGEALLVSVRTADKGGDAAELVRQALRGLGRGGGHSHRAGGRVAASGQGPKIAEELQERLRSQWLAACGVDRQRGTRLIAKREIVNNL